MIGPSTKKTRINFRFLSPAHVDAGNDFHKYILSNVHVHFLANHSDREELLDIRNLPPPNSYTPPYPHPNPHPSQLCELVLSLHVISISSLSLFYLSTAWTSYSRTLCRLWRLFGRPPRVCGVRWRRLLPLLHGRTRSSSPTYPSAPYRRGSVGRK